MTSDLLPYYWQSEKGYNEPRVWFVVKRGDRPRYDQMLPGTECRSLERVKQICDELNEKNLDEAARTPKEQTK